MLVGRRNATEGDTMSDCSAGTTLHANSATDVYHPTGLLAPISSPPDTVERGANDPPRPCTQGRGGWREWLKPVAAYGGALILSVAILALFLKPWSKSLQVPVSYDWGDGKLTFALIQCMVENGWYLHNDRLGAPFGVDMHDFPMSDSLHFGVIKLLSLAFPDWGLLYNLYFGLTFPLTAFCSLFVMRRFGISYLPALVASLLFTFLPYHFFCGYCGHIFLASYYV